MNEREEEREACAAELDKRAKLLEDQMNAPGMTIGHVGRLAYGASMIRAMARVIRDRGLPGCVVDGAARVAASSGSVGVDSIARAVKSALDDERVTIALHLEELEAAVQSAPDSELEDIEKGLSLQMRGRAFAYRLAKGMVEDRRRRMKR